MSETIREQILSTIATVFQNLTVEEPPGDPYGLAFDVVDRATLSDAAHRGKRLVLGVYGGPATKQVLTNQRLSLLRVTLEARVLVENGVEAETAGNRALGAMQRVVYDNPQWGGLAVNTNDVEEDVDVDSVGDRYVVVLLVLDVTYRHGTRDPRKVV